MRLIDVEALIYDDDPLMVDFVDERTLPEYAILSHMWEDEEVLYQDFALGPQHEIDVSRTKVRPPRDPSHRHATGPQWYETAEGSVSSFTSEVTDDNDDLEEFQPSETSFIAEDSGGDEVPILPTHTAPTGQPHIKRGWNKILNASLLACRDGFQYLWVDTCCIDKSSSAELSEAINSMYRWYSLAHICYAFLGDCTKCPSMGEPRNPVGSEYFTTDPYWFETENELDTSADRREKYAPGSIVSTALAHWRTSRSSMKSRTGYQAIRNFQTIIAEERPLNECTLRSFQASRWFTRGWTLQELIAPHQVVFYDRYWRKLGRKAGMIRLLSSITGIHIPALYCETSNFSIAQRMSWAVNRRTTREEDEAYCLLGLFNINMPLLYGEGSRAFRRLQEEILRNSTDASIFAWEKRPSDGYTGDQLFARSAADFWWHAGEIESVKGSEASKAMQLTNEGLLTTLHLVPWRQQYGQPISIALLGCRLHDTSWIGIRLLNTSPILATKDSIEPRQIYTSATSEYSSTLMDQKSSFRRLVVVAPYLLRSSKPERLLLALRPTSTPAFPVIIRGDQVLRCPIRVELPAKRGAGGRWRITAAYPSFEWNASSHTLIMPICSAPAFGAVAVEEEDMSGPVIAILFAVTKEVHWGYRSLIQSEYELFDKVFEAQIKVEDERAKAAKENQWSSTVMTCLSSSRCFMFEQQLQWACARAEISHHKNASSYINQYPVRLPDGRLLRVRKTKSHIGLRSGYCDFEADVIEGHNINLPANS